MIKWRWNTVLMQWEQLDILSGMWYAEHYPLPDWLIQEGKISAVRFIRHWQKAEGLSDVKKEFFWLSIDELFRLKDEYSQFLIEREFLPLQDLQYPKQDTLNQEDLLELCKDGYIKKEEYAQDSDVYDPMKALFQAQKQRESVDKSHIETLEVSDKFRFRARH